MRARQTTATAMMFVLATACGGASQEAPPPDTSPGEGAGAGGEPAKPKTPPKTDQAASDPGAVPAEAAWRKDPPKPGPERQAILPSFASAKLDNGLTVMVPQQKSMLPLVAFVLVSKGGAALDPPELAGLTSMAYGMLAEGSGKRDALQFSDALADLGATFGSAADRDRGAVSIAGLVRNADPMMELLADAVLRPRLAAKDFTRRKTQAIAALERNRGSPEGLAFEALPERIYGAKHPYGHPATGTVETVKKLKLENVKAAKTKMMGPQTTALIATGAISLEEAVALAKKHLGGWKQPAPKLPAIAQLEPKTRSEILLIDKAPAPQTVVVIGRPMFGKGHPDEHAMTVLNAIYGGEFTSRLNMNLREEKGYTYGASSQVAYRIGVGVFLALAAIRQDATAPGLAEFFKELNGLKEKPPTEEEVALAKAGIIRGLPGAFERTAAVASAATAVFVYELAPDYYVHLAEHYGRVTPQDVRAMAEKYLNPGVMQVLLVGDAGAVGPSVEKLELGKVVVRAKPAS